MAEKLDNLFKNISVADGLKSVAGENPEYDRALVEFIIDISGFGLTTDDADTIAKLCGITLQ